ncbi:M24 family metallopeptidase [Proteinivorax tanatarense]|uniref:M24 family metallopeptidase n=1 Tax=Proteinivorax tanatarense TaxID=1260629 RepID=A0AAU7VPR7_9FIRM
MLLSNRNQVEKLNQWIEVKLTKLLPRLMKKHNLDMWIVTTEEYNEDPVFPFLVPQPFLRGDLGCIFPPSCPISILVFALENDSLKKYCISPLGYTGYQQIFNGTNKVWNDVATLIKKHEPKQVALNISADMNHGNGLSYSHYCHLIKDNDQLKGKITSSDKLVAAYLSTRLSEEIDHYKQVCELAQSVIEDSLKEIKVNETTAQDLSWNVREKFEQMNLRSWFHPAVMVQRKGTKRVSIDAPLKYGDLVHLDAGVQYMGLCTDHQRLSYIGGVKDPAFLELTDKMEKTTQLQDIVIEQIESEKTGNEILQKAKRQAELLKIDTRIYCHPIGGHGHGAGPLIGTWNQQEYTDKGKYEIAENSCMALELATVQQLKAWDGKIVAIPLEENIFINKTEVIIMGKRQTELLIVE